MRTAVRCCIYHVLTGYDVQAIGEVLGALKVVAMQAKSLVNEESQMKPVKAE